MLLTLPLAAATMDPVDPVDCSSSYKNAITDLKSAKDVKEETINLGKEIVGNQISTASYTPVSLAGLPSDVGCNANDKKAYVFKMKMNVGDAAQFIVYTDTGDNMGSWQIRWCVRAKVYSFAYNKNTVSNIPYYTRLVAGGTRIYVQKKDDFSVKIAAFPRTEAQSSRAASRMP